MGHDNEKGALPGTGGGEGFTAGYVLTLEASTTILLFSLASSVSYLIYLAISWQVARKGRPVIA